MEIAVVILNWNGKTLLKNFLPSVIAHSKQAKIYVADNASTDDSIQFIQKAFPSVQIISNKTNGGYAKGYNDALSKIHADYYCLLNNDVEVTPNWLNPILKLFANSPKVAAIQPKILDYTHKTFFEYAGAAGGFIDRLGYPYCRGRIFDTIENDRQQYNDIKQIFWASGACLFIRKRVFEEVGKFDEDFFAHQEEIDLCWRIHNAGYHIMYVCDSMVYHLGGATLNAMHPKKTYYNFRNSLLMMVKNIPGSGVWILLIIRMVLDGIAGFKYLFERKPKHTLAILKAHGAFYLKLPLFVKKKKRGEKSKKIL